MKRQASLISIQQPDSNPRPRVKPKLRRQNAFQAQIHRPLRTIKPELKWVDQPLTANIPPFGGFLRQILNGMTVGGSPNQRVGRKINMTKLTIRYNFAANQTLLAMLGSCSFRIIVVFDKQTNGFTPLVTDILETDSFSSMNNLSNRERFITLVDFITPQITQGGPYNVNGIINRKFNLETIFNTGGAGTVNDIATGGLFYLCASSNAAGVQSPLESSSISRMRFVDF